MWGDTPLNSVGEKYQKELCWGTSIIWKGVEVNPLTVGDIFDSDKLFSPLLFNFREIPIAELSSMSRLHFLITCVNLWYISQDKSTENNELSSALEFLGAEFLHLLEKILGKKLIRFYSLDNPALNGKILCIADEKKTECETLIFPKDFDELRQIILVQNGVDFSEEEVPPALLKRYIDDTKSQKPAIIFSVEDKIDLVTENLQKTRNEISSMTLREFNAKVNHLLSREVYQAQLQGQMSGLVSFKKSPEHWLINRTKKQQIMEHFNQSEVQNLLSKE